MGENIASSDKHIDPRLFDLQDLECRNITNITIPRKKSVVEVASMELQKPADDTIVNSTESTKNGDVFVQRAIESLSKQY